MTDSTRKSRPRKKKKASSPSYTKAERLRYFPVFFAVFIPFYGAILGLSAIILSYLPQPTLYTGSVGWDLVIWGGLFIPPVGLMAAQESLNLVEQKAMKIIYPNFFGTTAGQRELQWEHGTSVHTEATMRLEELELESGFTKESLELWNRWKELYLQLSKNIFKMMGVSPKEITSDRYKRALLKIDGQATDLTDLGEELDKLNKAYWKKQRKQKPSKKASDQASGKDVAQASEPEPKRVIKDETADKKIFEEAIEITAQAQKKPAVKSGKRLLSKAASPVESKLQMASNTIGMLVLLLLMVIATLLAPWALGGFTVRKPFWYNYFSVIFVINILITAFVWIAAFGPTVRGWVQSKIYNRQRYKEEQLKRIMTALTMSLPMLGLEVETAAHQYPEYAKTIRTRYRAWTTHVELAQDFTGFADDSRKVDDETTLALARFVRLEANSLWRVRDLINGDKRAWTKEVSWWQQITNRDVEITATLTDSDQALATLQDLDEATKPANRARALRGLSEGVKLLPAYVRDRQKEGRWAQQESTEDLVEEADLLKLDEVYSALMFSKKTYDNIFKRKKIKSQSDGFIAFGALLILFVILELVAALTVFLYILIIGIRNVLG